LASWRLGRRRHALGLRPAPNSYLNSRNNVHRCARASPPDIQKATLGEEKENFGT
jgi:hypothetical protein